MSKTFSSPLKGTSLHKILVVSYSLMRRCELAQIWRQSLKRETSKKKKSETNVYTHTHKTKKNVFFFSGGKVPPFVALFKYTSSLGPFSFFLLSNSIFFFLFFFFFFLILERCNENSCGVKSTPARTHTHAGFLY